MHHILVVEDDVDIRGCFREMLEDEGYAVSTAENGERALEVLSHIERPCLMLVDLLMPIMNGIELIENLRSRPDLAKIPVVVVSAASTAQPPRGVPLLKKPVGYDTLLREVQKYCG